MEVLHSQLLFGDDSGSVFAEVLYRSEDSLIYLIHGRVTYLQRVANMAEIPLNYINPKVSTEKLYIELYGHLVETIGNFKHEGLTYYIWLNTHNRLEHISSNKLPKQSNLVKNLNIIV